MAKKFWKGQRHPCWPNPLYELTPLAIDRKRIKVTLVLIRSKVGSTFKHIYFYCNYEAFGIEDWSIVAAPALVEHYANLRHVDVAPLNEEAAAILTALGSRVRVLNIADSVDTSIAPWRKVH